MDNINFKKGKIAEKIVEQMFKEAGFKIKKAGYENNFGDLADKNNLIQGPAARYIRHYPDFIVIDQYNYAYLIEVKYRTFGTINQEDMFNFPETQVILLTKDSMHCQSLRNIHKEGKKFVSLDAMKPFSEIPLNIRMKYIRKLKRSLGDENIIGQLIEGISERIVGKKFKQTYTPGDIRFKYTYVEEGKDNEGSYENTGNKIILRKDGKTITARNDKRKWTDHEDELLKNQFRSRVRINDIAANLGRSRDAVVFRLTRLGLMNINTAITIIRGIHGGKGNNRGKGNRIEQKRRHKKRRRH